MRVIVAGSRTVQDYAVVAQAVVLAQRAWRVQFNLIITGGAVGVDRLAERWARAHGVETVTFRVTREQWERFGRLGPDNAGYRRNREMATFAHPDGGLVAVWSGTSGGTRSMITEARKRGLPVYIHRV